MAPNNKMIGKTISHYKILEKLGQGGMGVVYKAEDTKLKRIVALKFLTQQALGGEEEKTRFIHEAQAAAALDHPNICTVYEIDESDEQTFIAMTYVDGQSLSERIEVGPLKLENALDIAIQIAVGLQEAHERGIIHRDIKSANIMVTKNGQGKIMDFGLAKRSGNTLVTRAGTMMGTVAYMSPEQARGETVDHRTDIWSLGVVFYEMINGQLPFEGNYEQAVIYSILNEDPNPMGRYVPEDFQDIIFRALQKDREQRFQSASELCQCLRELLGNEKFSEAHAKALLPEIDKLAQAGNYSKAYDLAVQAERHLKNDSILARLLTVVSDFLTIITHPKGASIYLKRFAPDERGGFPDREYIGVTPINRLRIGRGDHKLYLEKKGFATLERVASSELNRVEASFGVSPDIKIEVKLLKTERVPENMVLVTGGVYKLIGWGSPKIEEVQLDDYLIDKYAVNNKQYREFIENGGYLKKLYWKYPFIKKGKKLSWEEAMQLFTDRTELPGPRSWVNQEFPEGKENHPVTDITWYEAAAYCEYVGKSLPTIFQWEKAARGGDFTHFEGSVMPWGLMSPKETGEHRANFEGRGTAPVESYEFGISPFGCYNMAGNVKEWCLNEMTGGYATTGGSWEDPAYLFGHTGVFQGFYSSHSLGFRPVRNSGGTTGDKGTTRISLETQTPTYSPVDEKTFKSFLSHYQYDKRPLNAQVVEKKDTPDWTREKILFTGVQSDRITAYLYLPKRAAKPFQCINFVPGSDVFYARRVPEEAEWLLGPQIKSGRALMAVVPKGALEREDRPAYIPPELSSVNYRQRVVLHATEFSLGLDYLATRDDIRLNKLAYLGLSWGAGSRLIFAAVDDRYRSVILLGGGIGHIFRQILPEANPINFAPRIKPPKLLLNGKYDEVCPYEAEALPLYNLLSEPKRLALLDGGHVPPLEERVPIINKWLDETLGPVKFE